MDPRRLLPVLTWAPRYRWADLPGDLTAGVTTAFLLIPQAMAYALLAGLPPVVGLYAAIAPPLVYALFGSSRKLAVGPVAMDSLLVAAAVGSVAAPGSAAYITSAAALALLVGAVQLGMGALRLGFVVNFLSRPVLSGFTSAAALLIAASQLGAFLGIAQPRGDGLYPLLAGVVGRLAEVHLPTLALGLTSVGLLALLGRFRGKALAVVALGGAASALLDLPAAGVAVLGEVPRGLPTPELPRVEWPVLTALVPAALTLALVSFMEAISSGLAVCDGDERPEADRELVALGLSNLACGLLRGYPVAGGLSRTAVNAQAGARSGLSGVITAALVAAALLLFTPLLRGLPRVSLAAIIVVAVAGLVDRRLPRELWRVRPRELPVLALTFVATLAIGITAGLILGVLASLALFVLRTTRPHTAVLGRLPGTEVYRNVRRFPEAETVPGLVLVRLDAQLYFANAAFLRETLLRLADAAPPPLRAVVLDASGVHDIDVSALQSLREVHRALACRGVALHVADVKGPVRDVLARAGFVAELGADRFDFTVHAAVQRALGRPLPCDPRAVQCDA